MAAARAQLRADLDGGILTRVRPAWLLGDDVAAAYLLLGDVALVLQTRGRGYVAVTAVCRVA